ncbi:Zinc import ATP-binding protein ZnuC [Aedoeadaptatus ivorii]|uniref:Zinc import ATP-binding protein ZnuC n=1 Tax=Aedoeadaptatus ivorii TaxID=54006 RepID=A0A448V0G7_9FIRM|nr:ATP-binding cassette domain-containing protein [Peptoniphilus ivorii]VEJ35092.1 Zinc import ATP-binding protein ZnuC [Peptoniphilus ivorii]
MSLIEMQGVSFAYADEDIIKDADFRAKSGEIVAICGENGSGKSTFLKLLLGELRPRKGRVCIEGIESAKIRDFRNIGYVPQVQNFNDIGFPVSVRELVALNLYHSFGWLKTIKREQYVRAEETLQELGMARYRHTPFSALSGGFKQRAMIARALINDPSVLILDEPTAGVDKESKESFLELINTMGRTKQKTVLIVTHEMELIKRALRPDIIYAMEEGRLVRC